MNSTDIETLLTALRNSNITSEDALRLLNSHLTSDLGFARVDSGRGITAVLPEVILAPGKSPEELLNITQNLFQRTGLAMVSRITGDQAKVLIEAFPNCRYLTRGRLFVTGEYVTQTDNGNSIVAVVSAGTSDLHAAEEASGVLETMKVRIHRFYDVGVAGIHRLAEILPQFGNASIRTFA